MGRAAVLTTGGDDGRWTVSADGEPVDDDVGVDEHEQT